MEETLFNYIDCNILIAINGKTFYGKLEYDVNSFCIVKQSTRYEDNTEKVFFNLNKLDYYIVENQDVINFEKDQEDIERKREEERKNHEEFKKDIEDKFNLGDE